jgi:hypothetical protein
MHAPEVEWHSAGPARPTVGELLGRPLQAWRSEFARELGLSESPCRVGTGHQAELWHCGILAKYLWADELASQSGADVVHLLVDTDARSPTLLRLPVLRGAALAAWSHEFAATRAPNATGAAPVRLPAGAPRPLELGAGTPALPSVAEGAAAIQAALAAAAHAPDRAAQAWLALRAVLGAHAELWTATPLDQVPWVRTSQLLRTTLGEALLDRMQADPLACANAFNAALAAAPRVARPLGDLGKAGSELPIWRVASSGARYRVGAADLARLRAEGALLAPSALLTGAIARAALADRFVHGTGARVYERATEAFVRAWLGADLPPFDTATATVTLPFAAAPAPRATRAAQRAAWFDPGLLTGTCGSMPAAGVSDAKRALLDQVAALPRRSAARRAAYRKLQSHLVASRTAHAAQLERLAADVEADRKLANDAALRRDRTWAAPLHPAISLRDLRQAFRRPA